MRRRVTATLLFASTALSIWIFASPSAGALHDAFVRYDPKDLAIQVSFACICAIVSFAVGGIFRK